MRGSLARLPLSPNDWSDPMRKFGLADALGIVASLVALAWLPGAADPLTNIKLLLLVGGGLALAPAAFMRWKALGRPSWAIIVPAGAALLILVWGIVSAFGSGAPIWNSLLGWWGRGDGWLAWLGAVVLLLVLAAKFVCFRKVGSFKVDKHQARGPIFALQEGGVA